MCQKVLLFRCLQQSELKSLSFKVLLGCYASRNCQTENKTRFILKEMLFWLQRKKNPWLPGSKRSRSKAWFCMHWDTNDLQFLFGGLSENNHEFFEIRRVILEQWRSCLSSSPLKNSEIQFVTWFFQTLQLPVCCQACLTSTMKK